MMIKRIPMLPKGPTKPRKPVKFLDTKVLIVTLSTAVTIGMWNLFSHNALAVEKTQTDALPPQDSVSGETQGLAPLPTLIPLLEMTNQQANPSMVSNQSDQGTVPASLRPVSAPSQVIVQKVKPVVDSGISNTTGGGGGKSPVAKTRSSR
jgi:hypothetical protein